MNNRRTGARIGAQNLATIGFSILLVAYIGFLLTSNYLSQVNLNRNALAQLKQETEKRASVVAYFFAERKNDLRNLAVSRVVSAYFENKALGMSLEYGLRASLLDISKRFNRLIEEKTIGGDRIYNRLILVNENGGLLVDSSSSNLYQDLRDRWRAFLTPERRDAVILAERSKMAVSMPYFFKNAYAGQIIAWIIPQSAYDHLLKTEDLPNQFMGLASSKDNLYYSEDMPSDLLFTGLSDLRKLGIGETMQFRLPHEDGSLKDMIALRVRVSNTPFSVINVLPASTVYSHATPSHLLLAMVLLSVLVLGGSVFVWRNNTHKLVLGARLDEASKTKQEVEEKNLRLKAEIEERQRAEEALRESEQKYRNLVESTPDWVWAIDIEGRITFTNEAVKSLLGYEVHEILGSSSFSPMHPEDRERSLLLYKESVKEKRGWENSVIRCLHKDGSLRLFESTAQPLLDSGGHLIGYTGIDRDVSLRKQAEEALRESEKKYRTVLEANPDPVAVYDIEGKVVYFNPAFSRVFGWTLEECLGKIMDDFVPIKNWPETRIMNSKVLAGKSFSSIETERYTKDGQIIPVSVSGAVYSDRDGNPVGSVINLRDISVQKKLEAQLQHAQKMEAVGTLAGGVAHDFNNLLQAVQGYAELLLLNKKDGETSYRELQEIHAAAKKGGELTRQLLTFSRKVESKLRPVDLNKEVEKTRRLLERTIPKMIEIELRLFGDLWTVDADPTQLEQIIINLAVNAKDAMPDGGKLIIETQNAVLDDDFCKRHVGARPGDYVLLRISDTGNGMEKNILEHIFEPFYTTKGVGEGTGLGLAMVYGIVKNHGGYIICSSAPGEGTTFVIYLHAIERVIEASKEELKKTLVGGTERILLVDDDEYIQHLGRQILKRFGYTVITAADGESALDMYRKEKERIDLVILDLIMPGMGGKRCLEKLLKIDPQAKVLIASGYLPDGPMKESLKNGVKEFISKPFEMRQLLQVVHKALNQN